LVPSKVDPGICSALVDLSSLKSYILAWNELIKDTTRSL
jgi:hypothetical protein